MVYNSLQRRKKLYRMTTQKPKRWCGVLSPEAWLAECISPKRLLGVGATICKYGVTITIAGRLMLILAPLGPDNTCTHMGHTPSEGHAISWSQLCFSFIPGPNQPRLSSMLYRAGSFHLTGCPLFPLGDFSVHSCLQTLCRTWFFFSLSLSFSLALGFFLPPKSNPCLPFFLSKLLIVSVRLFLAFLSETALSAVFHTLQC